MKLAILLIITSICCFTGTLKAENTMNQDIAVLNNDQQLEVNEWVEIGIEIMAHYGVDQSVSIYENLDNVYENWVSDKDEKPSKDAIIVGLGSVFGDRLNKKHGTSWKIITDQYGSEYAIILNTGHQIYPVDFVAKRVHGNEGELGFFSGLNNAIDNGFK